MHEPMGPVEIGVVKYHCYWKADEQVKQTIFANVSIDVSMTSVACQVNAKSNE